MKYRPHRAALAALLIFSGIAHQLSAQVPNLDSVVSPIYRGVSLADLAEAHEDEVSPSLENLAPLIKEYVARQRDLQLRKVLSVSLYDFNRSAGLMVVDIMGRDKAFAVSVRDGLGGTGIIRAEVQFRVMNGNPSDIQVVGHKIILQRDFIEMNPHIVVSLGDRLAVLSDEVTGFRRNFPLGVGGIDEVHFKGVTTIMTPTTELSVLDKNHLYRKRAKPGYFKNKPFIPLNVPLAVEEGNKPVRYRQSAIAFHIWQSPKFERGFLSHGCMRMRGDDLDELLTLVEAVKEKIPVKIRVEKVAGAAHPFPYLTERFNEVKNFGTKDRPVARKVKDKEGVALTATQTVKQSPPPLNALIGTTLDPVAVGPVPGGLMELNNELRTTGD